MKTGRLLLVALVISGLTACKAIPVISGPDKALIERAERGDTDAQFELANAYDTGAGFLNNGGNAKKWYLKAANGGHTESQNSIGSIYQAEKKYEEAMIWYKKAAAQGHALATNNMAYLYDLGLGTPQNRQKGAELYMRSAQLGWAEAMFNLGQMYGSGQLGQKSLIEGCVWTMRALKYSDGGRVESRAAATNNYCKQTLSENDYLTAKQKAYNWSPEQN